MKNLAKREDGGMSGPAYTDTEWLQKAVERDDGSVVITGIASDGSQVDWDNELLNVDRSWPFFQARMDRMKQSSGARLSTGLPAACSGLMYAAVPRIIPTSVAPIVSVGEFSPVATRTSP